jgi:hypothetical protein
MNMPHLRYVAFDTITTRDHCCPVKPERWPE